MKRQALWHSKMRKLCRRLDVPEYVGVGILESLWHLTAREAPLGDIGKLTDQEIALAIDYRLDAGELVEALVDARWLDRSPAFRLVIHDWHDHADDTIRRYVSRKGLTFASLANLVATCPDKSGQIPTRPDKSRLPVPVPVPEPVPEPAPPRVARSARGVSDGTTARPPTPTLPEPLEERLASIARWLAEYMHGEWGYPDDGIVVQVHEALRGAPIDDLQEFLLVMHGRDQKPKRSWKFFVEVIDAEFSARARRGQIARAVPSAAGGAG